MVENLPRPYVDNGALSALQTAGAVMLIGDSITEGVGASAFDNAYLQHFQRSVNTWREGEKTNDRDGDYGYPVMLGMNQFINQDGITTTGSIIGGGVVDYRLVLAAGQSLTIDNRQISYFDVYYDEASTTATNAKYEVIHGDQTITINKAVSGGGSGIGTTFPTLVSSRDSDVTSAGDLVRITAEGGNLVITGVMSWRTSFDSPIVYTAGHSGWVLESYNQTRINDLAAHVNSFRAGSNKCAIIALGTNNIYNPSLAVDPDTYIVELQALITRMNSVMSNIRYIISIPPRATESTWPANEGQYEEYVANILDFCDSNGHTAVRHDLIDYSGLGMYSDGVHPNDIGHVTMAKEFCDAIGIPFKPYAANVDVKERRANFLYTNGWADFGGNSNFGIKLARNGNRAFFSGLAGGGSATSATIGSVARHLAPALRDIYIPVITSDAVAPNKILVVRRGGAVVLHEVDNTPVTTYPVWVSCDGVEWNIYPEKPAI